MSVGVDMRNKGDSQVVWFLVAFVVALIVLLLILLLTNKAQGSANTGWETIKNLGRSLVGFDG